MIQEKEHGEKPAVINSMQSRKNIPHARNSRITMQEQMNTWGFRTRSKAIRIKKKKGILPRPCHR
jgi:hypothetical protein